MIKIPLVLSAGELIDVAFRRAAKEGRAALAVGGPRYARVRRAEGRRVKVASRTVCSKLGKVLRVRLEDLPPFYYELVDATIGIDRLQRALADLERAQGKIKKLERLYLQRIKRTREVEEAYAYRREFYGKLASILKRLDKQLKFLAEAGDTVKGYPTVEDTFTVVISGSPNVGKSTLLRAITPAEPKVESYPFTTQRILLGYFERGHRRYQVVDTPGLLDRSLEDRNPIEKQAVLALKHLADVVLYIFDPSQSCGYPVEEQVNTYREIKGAFKNVIPVVNKADLLSKEGLEEFLELLGEEAYICSAEEGEGVAEVVEEVVRIRKGS
jgi:nucleolar GTP-binding protein